MRWDSLTENDHVLARPENDPYARAEYKSVEEIFRTTAPIWHVHVNGQLIRTTAEHPFWVVGKRWVPARELLPGDRLRSHDGQFVTVEEVIDAGYEETVYNCRVAGYHTYYVTGEGWGFSVWAHNACTRQDFVSIRSARQLGNRNGRIFRMTAQEMDFVGQVRRQKPNLQIFRSNQTQQIGDFVVIDRSNPRQVICWVVELKAASGAPHAGNQVMRAEEVLAALGLTTDTNLRPITGNIEELLFAFSAR